MESSPSISIKTAFEVDCTRLLTDSSLYIRYSNQSKAIQELENLLLDENLFFHPSVHQRQDILEIARLIYDQNPYHLALRYQLSEYFQYDERATKISTLKALIQLYPEIIRYQIDLLQLSKGMVSPWLYNKILTNSYKFHEKCWYYTPAIGMAIKPLP